MAASEKFGRQVKAARAIAGLTQSDLAAALSIKGTSTHATTVSLWESGNRAPTLDQFVVMCRLFGWDGAERSNLESMLLGGESA